MPVKPEGTNGFRHVRPSKRMQTHNCSAMASPEVKVTGAELVEAIGVAVPVQDVAESRAAAIAVSAVKAVEPEEEIGTFVPESSMAEATVAA